MFVDMFLPQATISSSSGVTKALCVSVCMKKQCTLHVGVSHPIQRLPMSCSGIEPRFYLPPCLSREDTQTDGNAKTTFEDSGGHGTSTSINISAQHTLSKRKSFHHHTRAGTARATVLSLPDSPALLPPSSYVRMRTTVKHHVAGTVKRTVVLYGYEPRYLGHDGSPSTCTQRSSVLIHVDLKTGRQTFCVVSKRFRKNYIHRFTATSSFFYFSPWNSVRRTCIFLSTNQMFDYVVMTTILLNCVFLAMTETVEEAEYIFLAIYTAEMSIKSIAKGFILNKYTYLRNPWNWLDFVVITSGYATIGMEVGNLAGLRTFRVLRALKTVSIMPGLKTIINALLHSFKQLAEVMTLTIFCLMVFALFALQVYMGELRNKCVKVVEVVNGSDIEWHQWVWDEDHWLFNVNEDPVICGNTTGARHCPEGYFCIQVGENPNHGYTNFDNFLWSMLTTFQLITLDYWENVYNMVSIPVTLTCGYRQLHVSNQLRAFTITGPTQLTARERFGSKREKKRRTMCQKCVVVFFGSFYLINLMLAVVALSYEEEAEITQEESSDSVLSCSQEISDSVLSCSQEISDAVLSCSQEISDSVLSCSQEISDSVLSCSQEISDSEKRKDLTDHRDDSTFSFDPSNINVKQLEKNKRKRLDSRKGVLLASYTRKKTRRRKRGRGGGAAGDNGGGGGGGGGESQPPGARSRSVTPSPRHSTTPQPEMRPQTLTFTPAPPRSPGVPQVPEQPADTLHPANALVLPQRGQLLSSRHPSSNTSDNRESSLDDSGVVDDHEEGDVTSEEVTQIPQQRIEPVTISLMSPKEIRVIKCNGVSPGLGPKKQHMYTLPSDYLSHIVVLDDLPDRNCDKCTQCCVDYEGWLRFQSGLYKVVRDPLFDLLITLCIVLNTMFLAMEHHGMSESVRQALDIGNKVNTHPSPPFRLLDLSFELVDGLSVLRGLRLLRVLKLAQSWTTMKVLLSIIISTIGALGNLTFVLVIVIYIFAVIGMQLFSKDYTVEIFAPDPVPRWMAILISFSNKEKLFNGGENAEDEETAEYKALLRHHALVVARLWRCLWGTSPAKPTHPYPLFQRCPFPPNLRGSQESALLALSLNEVLAPTMLCVCAVPAFCPRDIVNLADTIGKTSLIGQLPSVGYTHHKEAGATSRPTAHPRRSLTYLGSLFEYRRWHTRHQLLYSRARFPRPVEVGEESKLARSFERLRSIVNKKRRNRERNQNEKNMRLEEMVREVMGTSERKSCGVYTSTNPPREVILRMEGGAVEHPPHPPPPSGAPGINARLRNDDGDFHRRKPPPTARVPTPKPEERRPYSQSVQESLDRHAKEAADKRYSLVLPRGAVDGRLGTEDGHPVLVRQKAVTLQDEEEGGKTGVSPQPRRVPWKQDGERNLPMIAQQSSSKDESNAEESIELEVLDKGPGETDTMLQNPAAETVVGSPKHPWHALVSYVDELTVGGRRDSQGHYVDGMGSFPGFGCNKPVKVPQECFPQHCFQSLLIEENENLKVLRSLRTLRALRPLRAISRWQGMRVSAPNIYSRPVFLKLWSAAANQMVGKIPGTLIVVNALMYAIPSIFNVLLVCLVFWLIFSIMGVQFFGGKFFKCVDEEGELLPIEEVDNMEECLFQNYTWINSKISFDNVGNAYLALFQVVS
uniref:Ion transport domain-containing protein n=3 Tax=Timema TaxID=61471 RepID=A0A7R9H0J5_TIMCR|nr:unnamed protein product [Timema cristinae]